MPTNANTFNSRVTSEALEAKFRAVFPAQGGAELVQDLFASGVIQPVIDFSSVAEGSFLPVNLQTAWDFSTGSARAGTGTTTLISNTGFWQVDLTAWIAYSNPGVASVTVFIDDGASTKTVWEIGTAAGSINEYLNVTDGKFVVFLRTGDTLKVTGVNAVETSIWYRQIADVNGNLVNPLGFTFS